MEAQNTKGYTLSLMLFLLVSADRDQDFEISKSADRRSSANQKKTIAKNNKKQGRIPKSKKSK